MGFCSDDCEPTRRIFPGSDCDDCGTEQALWDSVATEPARLAGEPVKLYQLRRAKNRDPVYGEPSHEGKDWSYNGPFELYAAIDYPQSDNVTVEASEQGARTESEAVIWISRKEFEDRSAPYPKKGDIIEFWSEVPFGNSSQFSQWDVVKATRDGNVFTTSTFVQFKIEVKLRSKFVPFRKTEHDRI